MVITGVLLFYAIPVRSYQSLWFRIKVVALILAGPERLGVSLRRSIAASPSGIAQRVPPPARAARRRSLAGALGASSSWPAG